MADVQPGAGGIRKHIENVVFRLGRIETLLTRTRCAVSFILGPMGLPFGFELIERVGLAFLGHSFAGREGNR